MKVIFSDTALKTLRKMSKSVAKQIIDYVEDISFLENPYSRGRALVGNQQGLWRYRCGDYRIICKINDKELCIIVLKIGHRSNVYK